MSVKQASTVLTAELTITVAVWMLSLLRTGLGWAAAALAAVAACVGALDRWLATLDRWLPAFSHPHSEAAFQRSR